ncbi:MAG: PGN_0703 family putative restriction endonuclease [Actinomycetota bacterium]
MKPPELDPAFKIAARAAAIEWKASTSTLPPAAREPGAYRHYTSLPFCLPKQCSEFNLLPAARPDALSRFRAAGVPWHEGVSGGPSNHLLSSQVQCANALAPFVSSPEALRRMFGGSLGIAEVLPFGAVEGRVALSPHDATDHVVFEWQGLDNHLSEWKGTPTRGSQATSADAAMRYRSIDGAIEMALIEWKYTESYPSGGLSTSATSTATRRERYWPHLSAADGPIEMGSLQFEDLLAEPVYQLMRLTLLAHCIETAHEQGVDRVRVLCVSPASNGALHASPCTEGYRKVLGTTSYQHTFPALLRQADRLVFMDSARLADPTLPLGDEFRARYALG